MNSNSGTGFLKVRVSTARDALPIPGALVRISPSGDTENGVLYTLTTNSSGETETVRLGAPPAYLSETPGNVNPFSNYNIEVSKDGYISVLNIDTPIFDGIFSVLPVSLVPLSEFQSEGLTVNEGGSDGGVYNSGNGEGKKNE